MKLYKQSLTFAYLLKMPGENCSIYGCTVSRRSKYKGVSIFKIPSGDNTFDKEWREKLVAVITRDREIDAPQRKNKVKEIIYLSTSL